MSPIPLIVRLLGVIAALGAATTLHAGHTQVGGLVLQEFAGGVFAPGFAVPRVPFRYWAFPIAAPGASQGNWLNPAQGAIGAWAEPRFAIAIPQLPDR